MPFDGNGGFTRTQNFTSDSQSPAPGNVVSSAKVDDEFGNFKAGLEAVLTRDGQNSPSANINWAGHRITNLGAATADSDALNRVTADARYCLEANNLSDLENVVTARTNLGLGFKTNDELLLLTATAPDGWTKKVTTDNAALRIVSGTPGSGGLKNFSTVFAADYASDSGGGGTSGAKSTGLTINNTNLGLSVAGTSITQAQLPANITGDLSSVDSLARFGSVTGVFSSILNSTSIPNGAGGGASSPRNIRFNLGGSGQAHGHTLNGTTGNHAHTITESAHTHTTPDHTHTIDLDVKYVDGIIIVKD